jgi:hypothetical protein
MKIVWAGLFRGEAHTPAGRALPPGAITDLDLSAVAPHDGAVHALWAISKEAEDRPSLGSIAMLVHPDGTSEAFGGAGFGGWVGQMTCVASFEALAFRENGAYSIEIRPSLMTEHRRDTPPAIEPSGERRLAILPLFVTGVRTG